MENTKKYYLKTSSEESLWTALHSVGLAYKYFDPKDERNIRPSDLSIGELWSPTGNFRWMTQNCELDIIGTIYKYNGNTVVGEQGFEVQVLEPIEGFHANLRAALTEEHENMLPIIEAPSTPYRVWAGE